MAASLHRSGRHSGVLVVGGRDGLGSKDFTPAMALAVYENLGAARKQVGRSVGAVVGMVLKVDEIFHHAQSGAPKGGP